MSCRRRRRPPHPKSNTRSIHPSSHPPTHHLHLLHHHHSHHQQQILLVVVVVVVAAAAVVFRPAVGDHNAESDAVARSLLRPLVARFRERCPSDRSPAYLPTSGPSSPSVQLNTMNGPRFNDENVIFQSTSAGKLAYANQTIMRQATRNARRANKVTPRLTEIAPSWTMATNEPLVNVVSVDQLAAVLKHGIEKVLVIDGRSFLEFNTGHIVGAINVCCSKLVKRRLQLDKVSVKDFLMSTCQINVEDEFDIVVYDQNSLDFQAVLPDSFLSVLLKKLIGVFDSVNLLQGGFLEFQSKYVSLCEDKTRKGVPLVSLSQPCLPISNIGPTRILPFLYLGSQNDAMNKDLLRDHNISYELNVSAACPKPDFIPDGHFLRISVNDNYNEKLLPHFSTAFRFVDKVREANGCVLVHCLAGISRSPTVAIAYIMRYLHMSSDEAYRYVKSKRATISPNFNFLGQLLEYERQLVNENVLHRFKEAKDSLTSPGHGNKRHCRATTRNKDPRLSIDTCIEEFCYALEGDRSATAPIPNKSSVPAKMELDSSKNKGLEVVAEESRSTKDTPARCRGGSFVKGVHKSQSTSNIWTLNSSLWSNERRSSLDSTAFQQVVVPRRPPTSSSQKLTTSQKKISFEGLKGIPFSSLDHIHFMPCRASPPKSDERRTTPSSCLGEIQAATSTCSVDASSETPVSRLTQSSLVQSSCNTALPNCSDLEVTNIPAETYHRGSATSKSVLRESSPRPNSFSAALFKNRHDSGEDEGIDLVKDELDAETGLDIGTRHLGSRPYEATCRTAAGDAETAAVESKTDQAENLESSYDSGVFPSPTQFELNEIIQSCRKSAAGAWLCNDNKSKSPACETCQLTGGQTQGFCAQCTIVELEQSSAASDSYDALATSVSSLGQNIDLVVSSVSTKCCPFPDRLYRTNSCPGIVGWIHHSPSSSVGLRDATVSTCKLDTSPVENSQRILNRRSCGNLEERASFATFDSCPDFGHLCSKHKDKAERMRLDASSHSATYLRPFMRRTSIIQVS